MHFLVFVPIKVLGTVSDVIGADDVAAKTVKSFTEIKKINSGLIYGYSQIGKIFTLYPPNRESYRLRLIDS